MKANHFILGGAALSFAYIILIFTAAADFNPFNLSLDFSAVGPFGDSFGPLNTFMTSVAAVAAVSAYLSQQSELELAKSELKQDRKDAIKRDFETTFFNMLTLLRTTAKEIAVTDSFKFDLSKAQDVFRRVLINHIRPRIVNGDIDSSYKKVYRENQDELGHYFRLFYHIVKYIDSSEIEDKLLYSRILRATLSSAEIVVIALNCLHGGGKIKLKPLVEKYAMLHNISKADAISWRILGSFERSAFGDRDFELETDHFD